MAVFLSMTNAAAAFLLFFSMSGISNWIIFSSSEAKIFPFLLGILLLGNAAYLALVRSEYFARRS